MPEIGRPAVEVQNLTAGYGQQIAIDNVSLGIPQGQITGLIGPNGAGKSTLLKTIVGILKPQQGTVLVRGKPLATERLALAYVPQRGDVDWNFPVTVRDAVMMGRYARTGLLRGPGKKDEAIVQDALEQVEMSNLADRQIGQLSGGQQQRAFVARALAQEAEILLLDEPLNGIDVATQEVILRLLDSLKRQGRTVVMATHDLNSVAAHCDTAICLNRRVCAFGPVAEVLTPAVMNATFGGKLVVLHSAGGGHILMAPEQNG